MRLTHTCGLFLSGSPHFSRDWSQVKQQSSSVQWSRCSRWRQCPHVSLRGGGGCDNTCCHISFLCLRLPAVGGWNVSPFLCERHLRRPVKQKWHKTCRSFPHCSSSTFSLTAICQGCYKTGLTIWNVHKWRMKIQNVLNLNDKTFTQVSHDRHSYWLSGVKGKSLFV